MKQWGFSLIEMMIAVAIIALLAAVSIPMYNRYQSKTRQAEAKINLAHVYSSEKTFYAEYSSYISSFEALHFVPEGNKRYYTVGWSADMTATVVGYAGGNSMPRYNSFNTASTFGCPPATATTLLPPPVGQDAQSFLVGAAGEVSIGLGCDVWTIDQNEALINTQPKL